MARDPTDLQGIGDDREEDDHKARLVRKQEIDDVRWLMSSPRGRRFIHRLLSEGGVFRSTFTGNSTGFYLEGKRALALFVLGEVTDNCMDEYVAMLKEAKKDE